MINPLPALDRTDVTFKEDVDLFFGTQLPAFSVEAEAARVQINNNTEIVTSAFGAASSIGVLASTAAASASAASTAKDIAVSAWAASTAPAEMLAARSQSLHVGAIVKAIVYDTSKDSDGGAWRQRCQDKSWYTEPLGGPLWIGQRAVGTVTGEGAASVGAARYDIPESVSGSFWSVVGAPTLVAGGYFENDATVGKYLSIPNSVADSITGDFEIVVKANLFDWSNGSTRYLLSKYGTTTANRSYILVASGTGFLSVTVGDGVTTTSHSSTVVIPTSFNGVDVWVKAAFYADNGFSSKTVRFFTSLDGVVWAQLGADVVTAGVISLAASSQPILVGSYVSGNPVNGKIYYAEVKNGVNGTTVAKFDGSTITENPDESCFQNTTDGKYYSLRSGTPNVSEVFRGITRDFPAVAGIVGETSRVVIYDLSTGAMWMVIPVSIVSLMYGQTLSSVAALNGKLLVGANHATYGGLSIADFVTDSADYRSAGAYYKQSSSIAGRLASSLVLSSGTVLVNRLVNDVALTVLDNAPIDPATGLPVPTIAVATAGGVSVIKQDGAVTSTSAAVYDTLLFRKDGSLFAQTSTSGFWRNINTSSGAATSVYGTATIPSALRVPSNTKAITRTSNSLALVTSAELVLVNENPATITKGMVAYIANAYNSGWMPGDIRGAWLADVGDGVTPITVTAASLALAANYSVYSSSDNTLTGVTDTGFTTVHGTTINRGQVQLATIAGSTYQLVYTIVGVNSVTVTRNSGPSLASNIETFGSGQSAGTYTYNFTATGSTDVIRWADGDGTAFQVSGIAVRLVVADRSIKNNGLIVNGTLTKTAVASGAGLAAYSGFSAANYLEQPYSANLNFTIPEFTVSFWIKQAPNSAIEYLFNRASTTPAQAIRAWVSVAGFLVFEVFDGTTTRTATGTVAIDDSTWKLVRMDCVGGTTLNVYVNGVLYATATGAALLTLANTAAVLRIGESVAGGAPLTTGSIALVRVGATVPSADQREFIYRTELPLFQAGAQCTIAGTSTAVTALAYDDATDLLHVGTSWGRTGFEGLLRIDSEATTTGALTSLSAQGGTILTGGTSAKLYTPAKYLRDELQRREVARKALGSIPVFFDTTTTWAITGNTTSGSPTLTATAGAVTGTVGMTVSGTNIPAGATILSVSGTGATAVYTLSANATATATGTIVGQGYTLPKGYRALATYLAGVKLVNRTSGVRVESSTDGFNNTVSLYPGVAIGSEISVMAVRE